MINLSNRNEEKDLYKEIRRENRLRGGYILLNSGIPGVQLNRDQLYDFLKQNRHKIPDESHLQIYIIGDETTEGEHKTIQEFMDSYFDLANIETAYLEDSKTAVVYLRLNQIELIASTLQYALHGQRALLGRKMSEQTQRLHYIIQDLINELDEYKERVQ